MCGLPVAILEFVVYRDPTGCLTAFYFSPFEVRDDSNPSGNGLSHLNRIKLGGAATTLIVHRALSTKVESDDKIQRHNLFHTFLIVKDCRVHTIIDGGSCNNLVNTEVVKKLGLPTREHTHPYHIQWLNNSGKIKVTQTARVHFSIGSYHDYADFDVVPMDACSLLLGRPWEFDTDALHHGTTNHNTLIHKGTKIVLLPMSPAEIVKYEQDRMRIAKDKRKVETEKQQGIKLKST